MMDGLGIIPAICVVFVAVIAAGVLLYSLTAKETVYVPPDEFDETDGPSKKSKKRKNGDRKSKKTSSAQEEQSSQETSVPESKVREPVPPVAASPPKSVPAKKADTKEQPAKSVSKPVEKQQARPAEKSGKADVTDGAAVSRVPTRSPKAAEAPSKTPSPSAGAASKAADVSPKPQTEKPKKSPAPQSKPKAVQPLATQQQKSKPKKKGGALDTVREQVEELDLSQTDCLELVRLFQERADQQGSWTTQGSKGAPETVQTLKARCEQLVEELESGRRAHTQHLHQLSAKRVELQEESKRLRIQCTELQSQQAKKDADIKQYISRVRQLEDDVAQKRAASDSDSTNSSLAEENTVLKMELSHLKSQVKETHVNGPTLADDSNNSKEVANLQREVAQLKKSLEKEQKAQKQPAKDSSASNAKLQAAEQENRRLAKRIAELESAPAPAASSSVDDDALESLASERDDWKAKAEDRGYVLANTNELLGRLEGQFLTVEQKHKASLEEQATALKKAQAELVSLRAELETARNSSQGCDQEVTTLQESLGRAAAASETLEQEISALKEQNNTLENQVDELRATNSALGRKVDSSEV